jgi:hypothetical protein
MKFLFLFSAVATASYPVPTPPNGRSEVHGWLILPLEQEPPPDDRPVLAWFSHHTPQIYQGDNSTEVLPPLQYPHDWQIIFLGSLVPQPIGDTTAVVPIPMNYPPSSPLLVNEHSITPPPSFSLNNLLNGDIKWLSGTVYNGSFDTLYERIPTNIGKVSVTHLTTVVWLNASTAPAYPTLQYLSYPRQPDSQRVVLSNVHLYLAHQIHAAPDFDQIVHAVLDSTKCIGGSIKDILLPGASWSFPGTVNSIDHRLMPSSAKRKATLASGAVCDMQIVEEIHCVPGPDFGDRCTPLKPE